MAKRHLVLCGGAPEPILGRDWQDAPVLRLQIGEERNDVHLRLEHLSRRLCINLPEVAADLLELAAYVYTADQAVTRGGRVKIEYGERWRRHFHFEVPVRRPDVWRRSDISETLTETLSFLSDDDYEFHFSRLRHPPPLGHYLFDAIESDSDFEEVLLFSGGLDSLGGSIREVLQGRRKVVLVSHWSNAKICARQRQLVARLNDHIASGRYHPLHVALAVNKGKVLGRDFNQRTRSFLFAAVAAVVARVFGLSRVGFYENGPVSLNLPVSPQVLGGRASRTTHPRVLKGFERLLKGLFAQPFHVKNPFLWDTRKEVLAGIKAAGYGPLCALTSSCTHTWEQTSEQPHCGRCSQCLDRRLAALSAGLTDEEDPPGRYRSDVVTAPIDGADLILAERYVGHILQADSIPDAVVFLARYPEVARVLRHVDEPPARAAELALDLYRRHAQAVRDGLAEELRRAADPVVWRGVPVNSLLGIAFGRPPRQSKEGYETTMCRASGTSAASRRLLVLDTESFEASLGEKSCFLGNTIEFRLLDRLNRRPGRYVSIGTLRQDVWDDPETEKYTIQRTISNLRRRLRDSSLDNLIVIDGEQKDHYRLVLPG
jgi:hypothetical protein